MTSVSSIGTYLGSSLATGTTAMAKGVGTLLASRAFYEVATITASVGVGLATTGKFLSVAEKYESRSHGLNAFICNFLEEVGILKVASRCAGVAAGILTYLATHPYMPITTPFAATLGIATLGAASPFLIAGVVVGLFAALACVGDKMRSLIGSREI